MFLRKLFPVIHICYEGSSFVHFNFLLLIDIHKIYNLFNIYMFRYSREGKFLNNYKMFQDFFSNLRDPSFGSPFIYLLGLGYLLPCIRGRYKKEKDINKDEDCYAKSNSCRDNTRTMD